ncbi:flower-specific gamma-thionin precursor [Zea mays]|uniref:Flower-specific gamma-thionin n=1 Tax=Zea mays TaxID=4577 RepID=B6SJ49_MAIZE|nr:flower-specific gamma-thionin precursor [Zea mays]ACG24882.1 flower-specific gamma-thionin precursor [Zea mays]ACG40169.1 flower-specific gamma-thionin precursor [Zea mays]ONL93288.1 Flower-specific gamma-thionin [Zea mays]|eukprot:NP_001146981.1 flower-specific gamma-thionin precursor [Zea mays]
MELSRKLFTAVLLVMLLLLSAEVGPVAVAEARTCQSQSHRFRGPCLRRSNCANVCRTEGFPGGRCRGFRRRCFCTTHCH